MDLFVGCLGANAKNTEGLGKKIKGGKLLGSIVRLFVHGDLQLGTEINENSN